MAEQDLDNPDVGPAFHQMRREAVAQRVDGDRLVELRRARCDTAGRLQGCRADRFMGLSARKKPASRSGEAPVGPQDRQQIGESMT